jgi:anti-sigma regulatory factor (Ser/Thr protein kinase)
MGATLALSGAVAGWCVMVLISRRRLAALRVRCDDAEAENTRWRQAHGHGGRGREPASSPAPPREREPVAGRPVHDGLVADGPVRDGPDFAERAFVNIGRRVQAIVHRQLGDLSEMQERHGGDAAVFADLMRLDHGTALIGRFADSLVVLAGERPGRQWTEPVPVFSVLRGAMSRIADYRRVELAAAPEAELAGTAVEAVVHALAELLDNATRYSPPDSRVVLTARRSTGGVAIEVVDAGVGMAPRAAEHAARVLADPAAPGLDLADVGGSPRLGLAVIGRLAHTVGFEATVRPSAAGGVQAQLFVPDELLVAPGGTSVPKAPAVPVAATGPRESSMASRVATSNGPQDGRPAGLPQRRRRPPTMAPTAPPPLEPKTAEKTGPGQWFDAFRSGRPESPDDDADHGGTHDGTQDGNYDGERGAAS